MSSNMQMQTNMEGGLFKGIGRAFAGESMFIATYTAQGGPGMIAFSSCFPGSIVAYNLMPGESIICQKRAFLAAQRSVTLEAAFPNRFSTGMFGGEGFIMQRLTGPGLVFVEIDGAAIEYDLATGQTINVDTGHVAMMQQSVQMDITSIKGFKNVLFGGEGLFLTTLTGPGHIWLQSMTVRNLAQAVIPYIPTKS